MDVIEKYPVKIFKKDFNGKTYYKIGLSKKDKDGNYINGYVDAVFRKDVDVDDSKKIYIKNAWLDFYKTKDNKTVVNVFINKFDYVGDVIEETKTDPFNKSGSVSQDEIILEEEDYPF